MEGSIVGQVRHWNMFRNIAHARAVIWAWATDFNETRPHSALGYQTPMEFAKHLTTATDTRLRHLKTPRGCRLLHLRQSAYQPKGLRFRLDESSVAGHDRPAFSFEDIWVFTAQILKEIWAQRSRVILVEGTVSQ